MAISARTDLTDSLKKGDRQMALTGDAKTLVAVGVGWLLALCFPVEALAQRAAGSFGELQVRVKIGDTVYVINNSDLETRGRIATLSDVSLTLTVDGTRRDFLEGAVKRIDQRRRDSVRNGLLIGLGTGALVGFLAGRTTDSPALVQASNAVRARCLGLSAVHSGVA